MDIVVNENKKIARITINHMNAEMVAEVSHLHMQAFKGAMNVRLGIDYVNAFFTWFVRTNDGIALVATNENTHILGYIVGAPVSCGQSMNRDLFWVASRALCLHPWLLLSQQIRSAVRTRVGVILGKSQELPLQLDLPKPLMDLLGFAVWPPAQGRGIGKCLLKAFEESARHLHMRSLGLCVYRENAGARNVYEQCGWKACESLVMPGNVMHYSRIL